MPELPEVETVVRTLRPAITGRRILNAEFRQLRVLIGDPSETALALTGRKVKGVDRHGKFIVIRLDRGFLVVHLGMTGKLLIDAPPSNGPTRSSRWIAGYCITTIRGSLGVSSMATSFRRASPRWVRNRWKFRWTISRGRCGNAGRR